MNRSVSAFTGGIIMVVMRWTNRLIGLISTLFLARLLVPEDFGIIAMASLVIGLVDVLLDFGVNLALIQNRSATQDDYNAAWTLRLIQAALASLIVLASADAAAAYFRDPRVAGVIQALAASIMLVACENIGIVSFQKNMEFGREFRFFFLKRIIGFAATLIAAWILKSYWALVIGTLTGRTAGVVLSYVLHPMRPRINLSGVKPILSFSTWNFLRSISIYLNQNLHRLFVGRQESSVVMGAYSIGSEIAALPSTELLSPLSRVLFPKFVELKEDLLKLKRAFLLALGVQCMVALPAGVGLVLVAPELVAALLGAKWSAAVPFIQILGAVNLVTAINVSGSYTLLALGRAKVTAVLSWMNVIVFVGLYFLMIPDDAASIATLRLTIAICSLLLSAYLIQRELPSLSSREMLSAIWRPAVASAVMGAALLELPSIAFLPVVAQLFIKVAFGAAVFIASLLLLWRLQSCPDGAESYLFENLRLSPMLEELVSKRRSDR